MSWGINIQGKGKDIKAAVADSRMPAELLATVNKFCDNQPEERFHLETGGHYREGGKWNTANFRMNPCPTEAPAAPEPAPVAATAPPGTTGGEAGNGDATGAAGAS